MRGKAGHSIPLAPSLGTVSSRILSAVLRIRTRRPLSAVPCFVLSVCHPNSFILQTHLVLSPSRTRMGLAIVSSSRVPPPRSCLGGEGSGQQHSGFIPMGGVHKAQCEVKRGMDQDLKSLGRDNTLGSPCPFISSVFSGAWPLDHCLGSPGCQVSPQPQVFLVWFEKPCVLGHLWASSFSLKTMPRYWHLCFDFVLSISMTLSLPLIVLVIPEVSYSHNVQSAQELRAKVCLERSSSRVTVLLRSGVLGVFVLFWCF